MGEHHIKEQKEILRLGKEPFGHARAQRPDVERQGKMWRCPFCKQRIRAIIDPKTREVHLVRTCCTAKYAEPKEKKDERDS